MAENGKLRFLKRKSFRGAIEAFQGVLFVVPLNIESKLIWKKARGWSSSKRRRRAKMFPKIRRKSGNCHPGTPLINWQLMENNLDNLCFSLFNQTARSTCWILMPQYFVSFSSTTHLHPCSCLWRNLPWKEIYTSYHSQQSQCAMLTVPSSIWRRIKISLFTKVNLSYTPITNKIE